MVINTRLGLILCPVWALLMGSTLALAQPKKDLDVGRYLDDTRFYSGFQATDSCQLRLTSGAPDFRKLKLKEQVFEVHGQSHKAYEDFSTLLTMSPLASDILQDFAVRLRILSETRSKYLEPYAAELLAIGYEVGILVHSTNRVEPLTVQNLTLFYDKVMALAAPRTELERVFAVSSAASLAALHASLLARTKDPVARLNKTFEALLKGREWVGSESATVVPLMNAAMIVTLNAVSAYPRVVAADRALFVAKTEALFSGGKTMLDNLKSMGSSDVWTTLSIVLSVADEGSLKDFPMIRQAVEDWLRLLGPPAGSGTKYH